MDTTAHTQFENTSANSDAYDPLGEYQRRLEERRATAARCDAMDGRVAVGRGLTFLIGVGILYASASRGLPASWLLLPVALFAVLVVLHERVIRRLTQTRHGIRHYERAIQRLQNNWSGQGTAGDRYFSTGHMYAADLDLFGRGSLFELICIARTRLGEDTLARWLSFPADVTTVRRRQAAVEELRHALDLREDLALLDAEVHDHIDQNRLFDWSQLPPQPISPRRRAIAGVLGIAMGVSLLGWAAFGWGPSPVVLVMMAELVFLFIFREEIKSVAKAADEVGSGLAILSQVLHVIEDREFVSPKLAELATTLRTEGLPPSRQIRTLQNQIDWLNNCLQNQFLAPLAFAFCLPIHLIHAIEMWRERVGHHIPEWLIAVGEFEAIASLSGHAFEHPRDVFPELVESGPVFDAQALGHPLLAEDQCVRNDLSIGGPLRLVMISGSNMSGKSTLLRSVGSNAILALAGATVRAKSLRISPLAVGTAMRVHDSLQEGASLFYSVISRIKTVVELGSGDLPLLFLLDEILQGTNSHDRRVGAEGIIRQLVERGSIGLVTTHDLALTQIVESFGDRAVNMHFEDRLTDGKMTFDYQMRPGVVHRSNALELMRMIGLNVDFERP